MMINDSDKEESEPEKEKKPGPTGKEKIIPLGGNILDDSFFDSLGDIDDGLGNPNFSKLGEDTTNSISDVIDDDSLNLTPKKEEKKLDAKLTYKTLPASPLPGKSSVKEKKMTTKKPDLLNLPDDDPSSEQMREIWGFMNTTDASEYKLMVMRLEPQVIKSTKISGYLETFHLPTTIPDIIEQVGQKYGGGKFQIRIVDGGGKYVKSKTFEISGLPKIPQPDEKNEIHETSAPAAAEEATEKPAAVTDEIEDDDDEWPEEDYYPRRPRPSFGSPYPSPYSSPYAGGFQQRESSYRSPYMRDQFKKDEVSKDDLSQITKEVESKIESKFDKMSDMLQNLMLLNNQKKEKSFLDADVVKALAPVVVTWLDGKANRDNSHSNQFSETNKQIVGLMEGMQNLVRIGDKTKEEFSEKERRSREEFIEKERREREQARKEALEHQRLMEEKFLEERRRAEERHQQMLLQMKDALESKHRTALDSDAAYRMQNEKMREEFREKEERARIEAREREERLREEARKRDEEARRREMEFWQKQRTDEMKWREEMRLKEEEARQRELQWREEIRQREVEKERELKLRELEMMKTIQEMNSQKAGMQQKLLEQVYSNNNNNRESQLQMEMAIARMTSDNEARIMQASAEMQLEKIRHATQMQMAKMKSDLQAIETKKEDDPLDAAMQDYLKRRLQIDMIKELNMDVAEDEDPAGGIVSIAKKLLSDGGGGMLMKLLMGGAGGGGVGPGIVNSERVVAPNPVPTPRPAPTPAPAPPPPTEANIHDLDDYDDEDIDDEDIEDMEDEEEGTEETEDDDEEEITPPDVDIYQEIPRVAQFFEYLKESIENGNIQPSQAAEEAKSRLSPEIVAFLTQIQDSKIVINQLYPLLSNLGGEEFAVFFTSEEVVAYMDKMLAAMAGVEISEEKATAEAKTKTAPILPKGKEEKMPKKTTKTTKKVVDKPKQTKAKPVKEESKVEEKLEVEEVKTEAEEVKTEAEEAPKKTRKPRKKKTAAP